MGLKYDDQFISSINKITNFWDIPASQACIDAVESGKEEDIQQAKIQLARHQACVELREVIFYATTELLARLPPRILWPGTFWMGVANDL